MSYPPCHDRGNMKTKSEVNHSGAAVNLPSITSRQLTVNAGSSISLSQPLPGRNTMPPKTEKAEKAPAAEAKPASVSNRDPKATATRDRELEAAISSITKTYGDGSIMRLGDNFQLKIDVIPT